MKFLFTFYGEEGGPDPTPEEMQEGLKRWAAFDREAIDAGAMIACEPLEGSEETTTIRFDSAAEATTTDGPFAESKEQIGGFCLLEVADRDEALEWAAKIPLRPGASMEVRPVRDLSEVGYESATVSPAKAKATA